MRGQRRRVFDYAIAAIFIVVFAVLFWPSGGQEDGQGAEDSQLTEEVAEATPEVTADTTSEPSGDFENRCTASNMTQTLSDFIQTFNRGNRNALAEFIPTSTFGWAPSTPQTDTDQRSIYYFQQPGADVMNDHESILDYLESRHVQGERWRLLEYRLNREYQHESWTMPNVGIMSAVVERRADDMDPHRLNVAAHVNCIDRMVLSWQAKTDHPAFAKPIKVQTFMEGLGPYGVGQRRSLRMVVRVDSRPDGGALQEWEIRREEATSYEGRFVERVEVSTLDGEPVVTYIYDGERWYINQRGWEVQASMTATPDLPMEITLTRREPTFSGRLIEANRPNIPESGSYVIADDMTNDPDELPFRSSLIDSPITDAAFEVEIQDEAVVRSRYRVSYESGLHSLTPEVRWVEMSRTDGYDPALFHMPPGPRENERQYQVPTELAEQMTFVSEESSAEDLSELYELHLEDVSLPMLLRVEPSRGGLGQEARGDDWDPTWATQSTEYSKGAIVWVDHDEAGYPTAAIWDTGRYRFELRVPLQLPDYAAWNAEGMVALVEVLSR